jgi:hypothetical protein
LPQSWKAAAVEVLDGQKINNVIHAPGASYVRKENNKRNNNEKAERLKMTPTKVASKKYVDELERRLARAVATATDGTETPGQANARQALAMTMAHLRYEDELSHDLDLTSEDDEED